MLHLGNPYVITDGVLHWGRQPIPKADPATFRHLGGHWGRDARQVFVQAKPMKADIATFELLNPVFARDANNAYDWAGAIKGADARTFEVLDSGIVVPEGIVTKAWARGYARDANAVYYHDQMFGRASAVRGADPGTFVSLRNDYGYDSRGVWHQKSRLPKADPKNWVYIGRLWSTDRDRMFYAEREITGIDRQHFTVVAAPTIRNLATDCQRFFDADRPLEEQEFWAEVASDFASFEKWFRVAYQRIRSADLTGNGSGG